MDRDEDGFIGVTDISPDEERGSFQVSVSGADVVQNANLESTSITTRTFTRHGTSAVPGEDSNWYDVSVSVSRGFKIPVRVALIDGPEAIVPQDLGLGWNFQASIGRNTAPEIGEIYVVEIEYLDGTQEVVAIPVTRVLNSFATHLAPVADVPGEVHPTFSWVHPPDPPAYFNYHISVWEDFGPGAWWSSEIPSSSTSAEYNFDDEAEQDPLTTGVTYRWSIEIQDEYGNQAINEITFTP